ncbi:MAG: hypothetical protein HQL96_14425 [Magnetococcales bacterium]|nr:hypothetical protein [Magnetococcales bacterium]
MMANLFYVSSFGGSATLWLARSLDLHDDIICFHGSRQFPLLPASRNPQQHLPNSTELTAGEFALRMQILSETARDTRGREVFVGGVHGFHGLQMHPAMTTLDGCFAFSIRHPVLRIASLYNEHYRVMRMNTVDAQGKWAWLRAGYATKHEELITLFCTVMEPNPEDVILLWLASVTVWADYYSARTPDWPIFRMEDYTVNRDVFQAMFHTLTGNRLACSSEYLDRIFAQGKLNVHRRNSRLPAEEFRSWAPNGKRIMAAILRSVPELLEFYQEMGYPVDYVLEHDPFAKERSTNALSNLLRHLIGIHTLEEEAPLFRQGRRFA